MRDWQGAVSGLLDDARADGLAQARARERWLHQQATEEATVVGTVLDLAEAGTPVSFLLVGGRKHDGRVVGLGPDVAILADRGEHVVVRLGAAAAIRPQPGGASGPATGDRPAALDLGFGEVLARVAGDGVEVAVTLVTGDVVAGELLAVGADVVTIRSIPRDAGVTYCPSASLAAVRLRSG